MEPRDEVMTSANRHDAQSPARSGGGATMDAVAYRRLIEVGKERLVLFLRVVVGSENDLVVRSILSR